MSASSHDEFEDIRRLRTRLLLRSVKRFAPYRRVGAAVFLLLTAWIVFADGTPWRIGIALVGYSALILADRRVASSEKRLRRLADPEFRDAALWRSGIPFLMVLQGLVVFATGGLFSPMLPVMIVPAIVTALFDEPRVARVVIMMQLICVWTYVAIHLLTPLQVIPTSLFYADIQPSPLAVMAVAVVVSKVLTIGHLMGRHGRDLFDQQLIHLKRARDVALSTLGERTEELTTLSGEIAHELKNPLASVKGLAALVGRDAEGRSAERLGVLRREVDRMQSILDEFLNFSRPLVPLSIRRVPLLQIASEVAELHEGASNAAHVEIKVIPAIHTELECDPRKIKQILVNLVQNALDAAPAESSIEIVLEPGTDGVELEVLDHGPGLDESAAARIFDAGVTTKDNGSGLGLTVARAIARQHGGELRVESRVPGPGTRAVLVLPREQEIAHREDASAVDEESQDAPAPERDRGAG